MDLFHPLGTITFAATLGVALSFSQSGHNLLKNGDFEFFTGDEPAGWETTNIPKVLSVVSASSVAHGGKHSVRCEVKDFHGSKMPGMIRQKNIDLTGRTLRLTGFYQLRSVGKDIGFISAEFVSEEGSTIKICQDNFAATAGQYRPIEIELEAPADAQHLDLKCTMLASEGESLHEGTYLLLDDLKLTAVAQEEGKSPN